MKIKIILLVLLSTLLLTGSVFAQNEEKTRSLFYQGNTNYSEGKFQDAADDYEEALKFDFESGPLYYNLGNSYFKEGRLGKAVLNYLRSLEIMPLDADLRSNLEYAQSLIKDGVIEPTRGFFTQLYYKVMSVFPLNRITIITSCIYFILSGLIIMIIFAKRSRKVISYIALGLFVLLIVSASFLYTQYLKTIVHKIAVVTVESIEAKFEPLHDATSFFTLNEGEIVSIISSRGDWLKIRRPDGKQAWLPSSSLDLQ